MDGGTRSPWRPDLPGRLLDLRCGACWALFRWDYFGSQLVEILATGQPGGMSESAVPNLADEPGVVER